MLSDNNYDLDLQVVFCQYAELYCSYCVLLSLVYCMVLAMCAVTCLNIFCSVRHCRKNVLNIYGVGKQLKYKNCLLGTSDTVTVCVTYSKVVLLCSQYLCGFCPVQFSKCACLPEQIRAAMVVLGDWYAHSRPETNIYLCVSVCHHRPRVSLIRTNGCGGKLQTVTSGDGCRASTLASSLSRRYCHNTTAKNSAR